MTRKNRWLVWCWLALFALSVATAQAADDAKKEITKVLELQVVGWNGGSIDDFMRGYQNSESTVFTSGGRIIRGWKSMLERYRQVYGAGSLGTLKFSDLQIDLLSKDAALVLGRWDLQRGDQKTGGVFTLLFRKTKAGWRIVHDHTSNSP